MGKQLGLDWLAVKRDDLIEELYGSTKVRKLDYLLAAPPVADSRRWRSAGAIGSGHLVALAAAAHELGHELESHVFWEPTSDDVLQSLAYIASRSCSVRYYESRVGLALRSPRIVLGGRGGKGSIIEPGATNVLGMVGLVRAGLELARQLEVEQLPAPDRIVVPIGSGGTVAGLMLGIALARLPIRVHGVAVVEAPFATRGRISRLVEQTRAWLVAHGVDCAGVTIPELILDRTQVGRGYGIPSPASLEAVEALRAENLPFEAVYSGKGIAAVLARPPPGERVLYWLTPRRAGPLPSNPDWRGMLPWRLTRRLRTGRPFGRRAFIVGALASGALLARCGCQPEREAWDGTTLAAWQAQTLAAVAEATLPEGRARARVPERADDYLTSLPPHMRDELAVAMRFVEQAPLWLGFGTSRMGGLPVDRRREYLDALSIQGGAHGRAYRAVRDLCMLAYYQQEEVWGDLGYAGPLVAQTPRADAYSTLRAARGARPRGVQSEES
jgi:D-cysteine desulfhydrase